MDLSKALQISSKGMEVQTTRLRVIAENLANQDTTGSTPGAAPFRRKVVTFENRMNDALGIETVKVKSVSADKTEFPQKFDPSNPAADAKGYIRLPNINSFTEVMDMREAQRSYSANLNVLDVTRAMLTRTIELLK